MGFNNVGSADIDAAWWIGVAVGTTVTRLEVHSTPAP